MVNPTGGDRPDGPATFAARLCIHAGLGDHALLESMLLLAVPTCTDRADRRTRRFESPRDHLRGRKVPLLFAYPGGQVCGMAHTLIILGP